jgi:hypothetical protein
VIGCFLIFAVLLAFNYAPYSPGPARSDEDGPRSPQERRELLQQQRTRDSGALASYDWVNREAGVVRLPVERAMELTARELQGQGVRPAAALPEVDRGETAAPDASENVPVAGPEQAVP